MEEGWRPRWQPECWKSPEPGRKTLSPPRAYVFEARQPASRGADGAGGERGLT